jgi:hypothetical protein
MEHYSQQARFAATRGTEVQPSTEVQAAWVSEILKPTLDLPWKD